MFTDACAAACLRGSWSSCHATAKCAFAVSLQMQGLAHLHLQLRCIPSLWGHSAATSAQQAPYLRGHALPAEKMKPQTLNSTPSPDKGSAGLLTWGHADSPLLALCPFSRAPSASVSPAPSPGVMTAVSDALQHGAALWLSPGGSRSCPKQTGERCGVVL